MIRSQVKEITPVMAAKLLENANGNRNVSQARVRFLADRMLAGEWELNGETIILSDEQRLLDGQHRLHAVLRSGISIPALVVTGVPSAVMDTLGQVKPRSASDYFSIQNVPNASLAAAATRVIRAYEDGAFLDGGHTYDGYSVHDMYATYESRSDAIQASILAVRPSFNIVSSPGLAVAMHYENAVLDSAKADAFWAGVGSGANLSEDSPQLRLRNKFIEIKSGPSLRHMHRTVMALCIKAWNLYRQGKTTKRLSWPAGVNEAFPEMM